jgi:hypothetical protein
MFTDRFIKVPSRTYNSEKKDLTGVKDLVKTNIRILPMEISEYYPSFDDDEETEGTQIYMKNGESLWIALPIREFEKLLNEHQKA